MPALGFPLLFELVDVMEYLGAGGPVVNSPNVDKAITTLAMNIAMNHYSCYKPHNLYGKH